MNETFFVAISFQKCSKKDTDFNECVRTSSNQVIAKLGSSIPELNLPSVDPLEIGKFSVPPGVHGVLAVEQNYQDCRLYGLSNAVFDKIM